MGQFVSAGTTLMSHVSPETWVIANFKETQVAGMQPGQPVDFSVDALGGRHFAGHLERFAPATGSEFSVLSASNATGNFTKIAQRLPVRIAIDPDQPGTAELVPGLSVVVHIDRARPPVLKVARPQGSPCKSGSQIRKRLPEGSLSVIRVGGRSPWTVAADQALTLSSQSLRNGHLDHLVGLFLDLLAGGGVAHHALGALTAVDLADARQGHCAAFGHFLGDDSNHGVQRGGGGLLVFAHFLGQCGHELGLRHRLCHSRSPSCARCPGPYSLPDVLGLVRRI